MASTNRTPPRPFDVSKSPAWPRFSPAPALGDTAPARHLGASDGLAAPRSDEAGPGKEAGLVRPKRSGWRERNREKRRRPWRL